MTGLLKPKSPNQMSHEDVMAAVLAINPKNDFVWDGKDDTDRPATASELQTAVATHRRGRGRPQGLTKEQVAIRFDNDVLAALRATGKGWQTRVNDVMRGWLQSQPA